MSGDNKKVTPGDIAGAYLREKYIIELDGQRHWTLLKWRGGFFSWEQGRGCYRGMGEDVVKAGIVKQCDAMGVVATTGLIENVLLNLGAYVIQPKERVPDTWLTEKERIDAPINAIIVKNGVLLFGLDGKVELVKHTPNLFALVHLPYEYDPEAVCERWMTFLEEVTLCNKELQAVMQEWAGYTITPLHVFEMMLILLGPAGAGKGTYKRILMKMLGKFNCSELPLRRFTDRFSLFTTYGKKLNTAPDAEAELTPQIESVIKTWTGEDGLDYEGKYSTGFTAQPTAKLMILCNDFPKFSDKTDGTWRRILLAPLDRVNLDYRDPALEGVLEKELSGVLNWAIAGLQRLMSQKGFSQSKIGLELLKAHQEEANPARLFLMEHYKVDVGYGFGARSENVYAAYRGWCKMKGYSMPLCDRSFGREVKRVFPQTIKRRLGHKDRFHVYWHMKLQEGTNIGRCLKG